MSTAGTCNKECIRERFDRDSISKQMQMQKLMNVIKKRARVGGTGRRIGLHFTDEGSPNELAQQCNPPILSNEKEMKGSSLWGQKYPFGYFSLIPFDTNMTRNQLYDTACHVRDCDKIFCSDMGSPWTIISRRVSTWHMPLQRHGFTLDKNQPKGR